MDNQIIKSNNIFFFIIIFIVTVFFLFKNNLFSKIDDNNYFKKTSLTESYNYNPMIISPQKAEEKISKIADLTIKAIKFRNFKLLEKIIHPNLGVKFSLYPYVLANDMVFSHENFKLRYDDNYVYNWNIHEENAANLTFKDYYSNYIYPYDYAISNKISYNNITKKGSVIDNSFNFYPSSIIVEYKMDDDVEFSNSFLRLVFLEFKKKWYLTGIIASVE